MKRHETIPIPPYKILLIVVETILATLALFAANRTVLMEEVSSVPFSDGLNTMGMILAKLQINYQEAGSVSAAIVGLVLLYFNYKTLRQKYNRRLRLCSDISGVIFASCMLMGGYFLYGITVFSDVAQIMITVINFLGFFFIFKNLTLFIIVHIESLIKVRRNEKN